jgi:hypothetical protein
METLSIEILNPKVRKILQQLADLNLIAIKSIPSSQKRFADLIEKIRSIDPDGLSMDDITAETETIRNLRHGRSEKD